MISFPRNMGLQLPFNGFLGGRLVFSYEEETLALQLVLIPDILIQKAQIGVYCQRSYATWRTTGCRFSIKTVKLNHRSILTSITLDLFSGKDRKVIPVPVPIVSLADYAERLSSFVQKMRCEKHLPFNRHNIVCREIFQKGKDGEQEEGFCFPSTAGSHTSLNFALSDHLFFLHDVPNWNFILIFEPREGCKELSFCKTLLKFTQENGYPKGANIEKFFSLSVSCISLLVSEHGRIITNSNGYLALQGIAVSLLQTSINQGKSLFFQRKEIIASPNSSLREKGVENINLSKFVKINCFCRQKNFFYSTHVPVLTSKELEENLRGNAAARLTKYGSASIRHKHSSGIQVLPELKAPVSSCLIVFPPGMEVDVLFGPFRGGKLFFSYSVEPQSSLQMAFFPHLFEEDQPLPRRPGRFGKNWHLESSTSLVIFCSGIMASVYSLPNASLVSCSPLEHEIVGINIEFTQTAQGSFWGVFCSTEKKTDCSVGSLVPVPSKVKPNFNKPLSYFQPVATVSVPPERQDEHRQKNTRPFSRDFDPHAQQEAGASGSIFSPYGFYRGMMGHFHHQETFTFSVPFEKQDQQAQQEGKIRPVSGRPAVMDRPDRWIFPFPPQATSTVSVSLKRQSSPMGPWDRRAVVPGSSSVRNHPYTQGGPEQQAHEGGRNGPYVTFFPTLESVIIDPFAPETPQQGVEPLQRASVIVSPSVIVSQGVEPSPRVSVIVSVGSVQQKPLWKPYE